MGDANGSLGAHPEKKGRYSALPLRELVRVRGKTARPCSFWARAFGISITIVLLALGAAVCFIMWGTETFDNSLLENLILRNNTQMFEWWKRPPVTPYIQVRLFNYTNWQAVMDKREIPLVKEVGPYTFLQETEKTAVVFNDNSTVTYREHTTFVFQPQRSVGFEDDIVALPNVPFLSAVSVLRDSNFMKQMAMSMALNSVNPPPFLRFSSQEFLWGYKETLTQLAKAFSVVNIDPESLKLGILEARAGVTRNAVTVETGARDVDRLGLIVDVGGSDRLDAWGGTDCSRVDGSDGSMFPPRLVQERQRLYIFTKDMCRRLALDFNTTTTLNGIETYKYMPPMNVFGTPEQNPENECFCPPSENPDEPSCPYGGVFSVGPCNFGAPVLVSFPHFYGGDEELYHFVNGLNPDPSKHSMYLYIHPIIGVPMGGKTRFQMNVKVRKSSKISSIDFLEEGAVLPVAWIEIGVDELPEEVIALLHKASMTKHVKSVLLYGSITVIFVTSIILLWCAYRCWTRRETIRNISQDSHILEPL
ncbi:hypothetical protein R5R35_014363 [Gryllus longicercus]|uniref:Scavenger receptor class B member 1 n=1 Tax=Gryllus longicercus TaxID=2509291 RepID=A0AAN9VKB9_9ORTH